MISPVYEYKAREREIYFPEGPGWYELETGKYIPGGNPHLVAAPYEQIPIHVKAGSILPFGPDIQYVGEKPDAPITLYVYAGADATFTLYEDEGVNYNYEKGAFSKIKISYQESSKTLVVGPREGSYKGMVIEREFRVILVGKEQSKALDFKKNPDQIISYSGSETSIQF
jgi:alpha-D-xyloside xylohydrolase